MRFSRVCALSSLVLASAACALPLRSPNSARPTQSAPAPVAPPAPTTPPGVTPIDVHIGRGFRAPWYELYFTDPADPAGTWQSDGLDEPLVAAIDAARLSVHLAMYNLTLNDVRQALIRAHRRGVDVRIVAESDNLDGQDFQLLLDAGVPVLGDRREGSMHDKFMVIDGREVWTGSMNYTVSGVYADNNCLIRLMSSDLAGAYEAEFAEMFEGDLFGPNTGVAGKLPPIQISGAAVQLLFAPDDHPETKLVDLVDSARSRVAFLAFSFTSDPLSEAVIRAHAAGLDVRGIMDEEQATSNIGAELVTLRAAGVDVRLDGNPGQMHEKVLVIDGEVVVLGSYNFSRSANETNDENVLIVYSRSLAGLFEDEFTRVYARAMP